ncbi:putative competence protein F [Azoarcus olearius]|nr:ComF family protein [Azoarcus olearius]ANQ85983.1 putative competence protein F [Azoarcus olearius]
MLRLLDFVVDALIPQDCFLCGAPAAGRAICTACEAELPGAPAQACPCCAVPVASGGRCGECLQHPPAFDSTVALFAFAFPVDRMVHALKYRHRLGLADYFAAVALRRGLPPDIDMVLPMPLHPARLAERGFNQSVEIARPLARALGVGLELSALKRVRNIPTQSGLSREERQRNVRGAFDSATDLRGRCVLVLDDVMTTGATLSEAARILKRRGAERVDNLVIARTPPPG